MSSPARVIGYLEVGRVLLRLPRGPRDEIRAVWHADPPRLALGRWRLDAAGAWQPVGLGLDVRVSEVGAFCTLAAEVQALALLRADQVGRDGP